MTNGITVLSGVQKAQYVHSTVYHSDHNLDNGHPSLCFASGRTD
jgi:hypothetical protein